MFDYRQELERRIGQFAGYLKKMDYRTHEEVGGSCFIVFTEEPPANDSGNDALTEAATPAVEQVLAAFDAAEITSVTTTDESLIDLPDEGWKVDDSLPRFIQFSFERDWFCLDMPIQTLYRAEAEQILRSRKGFFYLRDQPQFTLNEEDVDGYDPFRKVYLYGDEQSAAEDMAFIFFQVWRFPVDWQFFVRAAAFGDKVTDWENGTPMEMLRPAEGTTPMPRTIKVDSATFQEKGNVTVDERIPGITNIQVCSGGGGWPTPYEVGIYLDANGRCAIVNWSRPCDPIKVICEYGDFVVHLDTASKDAIASAEEVDAEFFRDDW